MNIRIKKYSRGYVSEIQKEKTYFFFIKKKHWSHFISVSGIESEPWFHKSFDSALDNTLFKIKSNIIKNGGY